MTKKFAVLLTTFLFLSACTFPTTPADSDAWMEGTGTTPFAQRPTVESYIRDVVPIFHDFVETVQKESGEQFYLDRPAYLACNGSKGAEFWSGRIVTPTKVPCERVKELAEEKFARLGYVTRNDGGSMHILGDTANGGGLILGCAINTTFSIVSFYRPFEHEPAECPHYTDSEWEQQFPPYDDYLSQQSAQSH